MSWIWGYKLKLNSNLFKFQIPIIEIACHSERVEELGAISCYPLVSFHPQKADKKDTASIRARAFVFIIKNINSNYTYSLSSRRRRDHTRNSAHITNLCRSTSVISPIGRDDNIAFNLCLDDKKHE